MWRMDSAANFAPVHVSESAWSRLAGATVILSVFFNSIIISVFSLSRIELRHEEDCVRATSK